VHEEGGVGEEEGEGEEELESSPKRPAKKRQKKRNGQEKSDAEYARQLSNELNGRQRSSRSTIGKPKSNVGRKGGPGKRNTT